MHLDLLFSNTIKSYISFRDNYDHDGLLTSRSILARMLVALGDEDTLGILVAEVGLTMRDYGSRDYFCVRSSITSTLWIHFISSGFSANPAC